MQHVHFDHFDLNRETVKLIAIGPECRKMVTEHGEMAKAYAKTLAAAAVGRDGRRKHNHYLDSFELEVENVHGIPWEEPMTRVAARLSNSAPHANMIEFGFINEKTGAHAEGHFVLHDTLGWLEGFDTVRFVDEPTVDDGHDGYEDPYSIHDFGDY